VHVQHRRRVVDRTLVRERREIRRVFAGVLAAHGRVTRVVHQRAVAREGRADVLLREVRIVRHDRHARIGQQVVGEDRHHAQIACDSVRRAHPVELRFVHHAIGLHVLVVGQWEQVAALGFVRAQQAPRAAPPSVLRRIDVVHVVARVDRAAPRGRTVRLEDRHLERELLGDARGLRVAPARVRLLAVARTALQPLQPADHGVVLFFVRTGLDLHADRVARVGPKHRREGIAALDRAGLVERVLAPRHQLAFGLVELGDRPRDGRGRAVLVDDLGRQRERQVSATPFVCAPFLPSGPVLLGSNTRSAMGSLR